MTRTTFPELFAETEVTTFLWQFDTPASKGNHNGGASMDVTEKLDVNAGEVLCSTPTVR